MAQCPKCKQTDSNGQRLRDWKPDQNKKRGYAEIECGECGCYFWVQYWWMYVEGKHTRFSEYIDTSIVQGLMKMETDKPLPEQLRHYWLGGGGG